jgi:hypothetical protein
MSETNEVTIDPSIVGEMTVGEIEMLEERTGRPVTRIFDDGVPLGTALRTLAFLVRRREDPAFTWEQSAELRVNLTSSEANGKNPTQPARRQRRGG